MGPAFFGTIMPWEGLMGSSIIILAVQFVNCGRIILFFKKKTGATYVRGPSSALRLAERRKAAVGNFLVEAIADQIVKQGLPNLIERMNNSKEGFAAAIAPTAAGICGPNTTPAS